MMKTVLNLFKIGILLILSTSLISCDIDQSQEESHTEQKTESSRSTAKQAKSTPVPEKKSGEPGQELSSNEMAGISTIMYQWDGDGFASNMNAMFQNNKMISKAQFGLK